MSDRGGIGDRGGKGHLPGGLGRRVERLEARLGQRIASGVWRAWLGDMFSEEVYGPHREALLDALCSEQPSYLFAVGEGDAGAQGQEAHYLVTWGGREQGAPPDVLVIRREKEGVR